MAFNLFKGVRVPKNGRNPPYESFWKAAVSAPKSRVCVLLPCSSSWFTTFGWARFPAVWMSSCSSPPFLLSLSFMRKINEGKPLNLLNYWTHVFTRRHPGYWYSR